MNRWIVLLVGMMLTAGALAGAERGELVRIQRGGPQDREILLDRGVPLVAEFSQSLLALDADGLVGPTAKSLGYAVQSLDTDTVGWHYAVAFMKEGDSRDVAMRCGEVVWVEENWVLFKRRTKEMSDCRDSDRWFVRPLALEPLRPPKVPPERFSAFGESGNAYLATQPLVQDMVNACTNSIVESNFDAIVNSASTRYSTSAGCQTAATNISNKFAGLGLDPLSQNHTANHAPNVIGTITGKVNPQNVYIAIGHLDDMPSSGSAPGANDNASGTAMVTAVAEMMAPYAFENTVKFLAVTGEEFGLYGSEYYANDAAARGEQIQAVLDADMIGWQGMAAYPGEDININYNGTQSQWLANLFNTCAANAPTGYSTGCPVRLLDCASLTASDHAPFWDHGWSAIAGITTNAASLTYYFCVNDGYHCCYHQATDTKANCGDLQLFYASVRAYLATLAHMAVPLCKMPSAPTGPAAAAQGANQILVSWSSAGAGLTYEIYRAPGGCSGPLAYYKIGESSSTSYLDTTASANITYAYKVHARDATGHCRSSASACVNGLTPTGGCLEAPAFAGLSSVSNPQGSTCTLNLAWSAGSAYCTGPVWYSVYRSTISGFTPGPANRIASGLSGTSYSDLDQLVSGTTYYYVVRAVDASNGTEDTNMVEWSGKPTGPATDGTWTAGAETGDPVLTLSAPWAASTTYRRNGTSSYSTGASYPNNACGALMTPALSLGSGSVLTFYHIHSTESGYDGGRAEISAGGGPWTALTPTPAYPGTITSSGNACAWPTTTACYIGNSTGYPNTWQSASISLSAYNGQTVQLRWNFTSDVNTGGSGSNPGWYIDDIQITHVQVPGTCATGSNCANNPSQLSVTPDGPLTLCAGTAQLLTATPTGGVGTTYQWYDGLNPIEGATASTYSANAAGTHSYNCQAKGSGCSSAISDATPTAITWQVEPTFAGLTSVTNPAQATCRLDLAWSAGSTPCAGGVTYNIYRATTPGFTPAVGNRIAAGVTGTGYQDSNGLVNLTTYYYKTRAVTVANGTEETNTVERSGAPTGAGSSSSTLFSESFDGTTFPPMGWTETVVGSSTTAADWARVTTSTNPTGISPHTGAAMAEFNSYHAQSGGSNRLVRTANLDIPAGTTTASAVLWVYHETGYTTNQDRIQVQTSPDGTTWTNRGTAVNRYDGTTGWKQHAIDLSALIGAGNFRIGFLGISAYGNDTYLDDVSVSTTTPTACATGFAAPPPVMDSGSTAAKFTKEGGNTLNVTYDSTTCSAQKVVILYNTIGTWTGYAGCAQSNGGNGGSTTVDSTGQTSTWYNLVWTSGTTAGHPGFAFNGTTNTARTWNVGTLCGMASDDKTHATCP